MAEEGQNPIKQFSISRWKDLERAQVQDGAIPDPRAPRAREVWQGFQMPAHRKQKALRPQGYQQKAAQEILNVSLASKRDSDSDQLEAPKHCPAVRVV